MDKIKAWEETMQTMANNGVPLSVMGYCKIAFDAAIEHRGMTLYDMTQLVCGELPEAFEMMIEMENGSASVKLEMDDGGRVEGDEMPDNSIEKQIVELVKLAKGEDSEYTYAGWNDSILPN